MNFSIKNPENEGGMNERIKRLRQQCFDTPTTLSIERALIETEFYKKNYGTMPIAVLRAKNFYEICKKKTTVLKTLIYSFSKKHLFGGVFLLSFASIFDYNI